MKLNLILISIAALTFAGCGSSTDSSHEEEKPFFKGQVVKVQYRLTEGKTILIDAAGKEIELEGHPGIPCADIEIFKHGHEYEVFQVAKQG
jgi:hypothetical protein